jgi:hypothetical protein
MIRLLKIAKIVYAILSLACCGGGTCSYGKDVVN